MLVDSTAIRAKQKGPFYSIQETASHLKATVWCGSSSWSGFHPYPIQSLPHSPRGVRAFCWIHLLSRLIFLPLQFTPLLTFPCTPLTQNLNQHYQINLSKTMNCFAEDNVGTWRLNLKAFSAAPRGVLSVRQMQITSSMWYSQNTHTPRGSIKKLSTST